MSLAHQYCRLFDTGTFTAQPKIAIFRALSLGEMLCAVPALRALRAALPAAHITLIGLPWARSFVQRFSHYVDHHVAFPGFPGLPGQSADLSRLPGFITAMQRQQFDCLLQMHGNGVLTNALTRTFGAARNVGYYRQGEYCPDPLHFMHWNQHQHDIVRLAHLLTFLGVPAADCSMEFPLTAMDQQALYRIQPTLPAAHSYVCIHPGARLAAQRWPVERFAEIADGLHAAGVPIVLVGSPQERQIAAAVMTHMKSPVINLTGALCLGAFAALLAQARLIICNDTGITHLAAALRTPSLALCRDSSVRRWAPLEQRWHRHVNAVAEQCTYTAASTLVMKRVRALLEEIAMPLAGLQ